MKDVKHRWYVAGGAGVGNLPCEEGPSNPDCFDTDCLPTAKYLSDNNYTGIVFDLEGCIDYNAGKRGTTLNFIKTWINNNKPQLNNNFKFIYNPLMGGNAREIYQEAKDGSHFDYILLMLYWGEDVYTIPKGEDPCCSQFPSCNDGSKPSSCSGPKPFSIQVIQNYIKYWTCGTDPACSAVGLPGHGVPASKIILGYSSNGIQNANREYPTINYGTRILNALVSLMNRGGYAGIVGWSERMTMNDVSNSKTIISAMSCYNKLDTLCPRSDNQTPLQCEGCANSNQHATREAACTNETIQDYCKLPY